MQLRLTYLRLSPWYKLKKQLQYLIGVLLFVKFLLLLKSNQIVIRFP